MYYLFLKNIHMTSLLSRQRNYLFLKNIVKGDKKYFFYDFYDFYVLPISQEYRYSISQDFYVLEYRYSISQDFYVLEYRYSISILCIRISLFYFSRLLCITYFSRISIWQVFFQGREITYFSRISLKVIKNTSFMTFMTFMTFMY